MMRKIFAALLACGMIFSAGVPFSASAAVSDPYIAQLRAMIAQLQQQIMMLQQQLYAQEPSMQQPSADGAQTQASHIGLAYIISYPETVNVTPGQAGVTAILFDVKSIKESAFLSGLTLSYKPSQQDSLSGNYPVRAALYSGSTKIADGTFSQGAYSFDFEQVISPTVARRLAVKVDVSSTIATGGNFSITSYSITDASDATSSKPANISGNTLAYASRVSPSPSPAESRNITISAPEQGEAVVKGTQYMIQWSSRTAPSSDFAIYLKQEGGATTRIGSAPATARSFSWFVSSNIADGRYKISIQPATNAAQGGESGIFTIASSSDAGKPGTPSNLLLSLNVNPERISVRPGQTDVAAMSFSARSVKGTAVLSRLTLSYKPSQQDSLSGNYPVRAALYSGSTKIAEGTGSQGYYLFDLDQMLQQQAAKPFTVKVDIPYAITSGGTFFLIGYTVMDALDASHASAMNIAGNTLLYSEPANNSKKITIDSPSTGEIVAKGTTVSVDWITPNNTSNGFNIFMTKEGGSKMLLESVAGSERTYAWPVPGNIVEGKYMASVEFKTPPTIGGVGGWFTITGGQTPPPQPFAATLSGRTEIGAGEAGTWTIQASGTGSSSFLSRITDWGDGTGGSYPPTMTSTRSYSHAYAKAGTYIVTASIAGGGTSMTKTLSVKVKDGTTPPPATPLPTTPPPSSLTVQPVDGPSSVLVNQSNSWAISATGGTSSTWYMMVEWGDGARSSVMTCSNPCYAHHTYASAGTYSVQFKVSSESNGRVYTTKPWTVQAQYDAAIAVPDKPVITSAVLSGPTAVTLSWNPAARACGYNVYRSVDVPDDESLIAKVTSGTTSYTDSGLAANKDYYYYVKAYCAYGESPMSRVPYEMHTLAPIGVSLSPDAGTIQISWNNPNSEYAIANLVIERNGTQIYNAANSGRSKTITSLVDGITANGSVSYTVAYTYSVPDGVTRVLRPAALSAQKSINYTMAAGSSIEDMANVLESASQAIARLMGILNAR